MNALFTWIETTSIARTVGGSVYLTASLSAMHLLGFTLVTSGALVANLRSLGALFAHRPIAEVLRPANRALLVGLAISLSTGALLFSTRATAVSANGTFQLKMLLLIAAAIFHFAMQRGVLAQQSIGVRQARAAGAVGLSLWMGLAVTACAFILLE